MEMLTVARFEDRTQVLGPGVRVAIWFHGCRRNCPGCIAREMNASPAHERWRPEDLARRVRAVAGVEGVTLSGGEPFDQDPDALRAFLSDVRAGGLSVMAYTGDCLEALRAAPGKAAVLDLIDILVDGPYVEAEDHGELWRGSANQRIHFLSDRYRELSADVTRKKGRLLEFSFQEGLSFTFTGIPPKGLREKLRNALSGRGLEVSFT